ncbi:MAG: hypothetical protein J1F67_06410, partial [Muribaculaceae bacterium]|nr:hypothetical protein [Muribaculaceae bacterium]
MDNTKNIEEKIKLTITDYGIYILSINRLLDFLRVRNIRSNKILSLFQDNHELYLESLLEGVWIPITPIVSTKYIINGIFPEEEWKECFEYKNFNLEITDNSYWVGSFGNLLKLNRKQFLENSSNSISYKTLDNKNILSAIRFKLENGLYYVNLKGYERIQHQ